MVQLKASERIYVRSATLIVLQTFQICELVDNFQVETESFKFTKHVSDDQHPSSVANTNELRTASRCDIKAR